MSEPGGLVAALVAAQRAIRSVAKDSQNMQQKYRYASSEAVLDEARRVLTEHGLCAWLVSSDYVDTVITSPGTRERPETSTCSGWVLTCLYRLEHVGGEHRETRVVIPVIPGGGRPLDKAMMAARTVSLAYYLRDLLLLSRGEDSDAVDQRDDHQYEPAPAQIEEIVRLASRDIADAKKIEELHAVGKRIGGTAAISGGYRAALLDEYKARAEALRRS